MAVAAALSHAPQRWQNGRAPAVPASQVTGKIDKSSGAVTAFYTRSSDDYNLANQGDFDEIDFEVQRVWGHCGAVGVRAPVGHDLVGQLEAHANRRC